MGRPEIAGPPPPATVDDDANPLHVDVCYARPQGTWWCALRLPAGATVRQAIAASGFAQAFPDVDPFAHGVGVYGALHHPDQPLEHHDRVEILRPLRFDPMESRRRRAAHKAAGRRRANG